MSTKRILILGAMLSLPLTATAGGHAGAVADSVIDEQRANLATNTAGKGFGPQSPRDIDSAAGTNTIIYNQAPPYQEMNLCNIHFHKNAEHSGGEFARYAGNGDGKGNETGFMYSGSLSSAESKPLADEVCVGDAGGLQSGDTIELHYVHSSAQITPGPTLGACLADSIMNPQLRVETQVYVLVNDDDALDFGTLTEVGMRNGKHQALNIPDNTGTPIQYTGSTTGPGYNEKGSPFQVSWSVRPKVAKVNIDSVGEWCQDNIFDEGDAHGVRNLVVNEDLLSPIK